MPNIIYKKVLSGDGSNEPKQETIFVSELEGPFIDKIALTVPLPLHEQAYALSEVWAVDDSLNPKKTPEGKAGVKKIEKQEGIRRGPRGGYKFAIWVRGVRDDGTWSDEDLLFQAVPKQGAHAFYRLEWNPRRYGPESLERVKVYLSGFMSGGWEHVIAHARVTRLDVGIDLTKVHVDTLVMRGNKPQKFGLYTGTDGRIETIYVGAPNGSHIIAYDRMKSIKGNGSKEPIPLIGPVTRIESVKRNANVPLSTLKDQADPFKALQVFQFPTDEHLTWLTTRWPTFRDMCQVRGFHRAMNALTPTMRKVVRKSLPELRPHWWDQDKIWKRWTEEIDKQRLVKTIYDE